MGRRRPSIYGGSMLSSTLAKYWGQVNGLHFSPAADIVAKRSGQRVALSWAHVWDLYEGQIRRWVARLTAEADPDLDRFVQWMADNSGSLPWYVDRYTASAEAAALDLTTDPAGKSAASVVGAAWRDNRLHNLNGAVFPSMAIAGRLLADPEYSSGSFLDRPGGWAVPAVLGQSYAFPVMGGDWAWYAPAGSTVLLRFWTLTDKAPAAILGYTASLAPLVAVIGLGLAAEALLLIPELADRKVSDLVSYPAILESPALPLDFFTVGRYSLSLRPGGDPWPGSPALQADPLSAEAERAILGSKLFGDLRPFV